MTLVFGTAGVPHSSKDTSTLSGIERVKALGLGALEVEWVRGVKMNDELASEIKKLANHLDIKLTAHGPYWINLNAIEKEKLAQSKERVLKTVRTGFKCGCESITFHPAYYLKEDPKSVYKKIKDVLEGITKTLKNEGIKLRVSLETTGKPSQFGTVDEILSLSQEIDMIWPCIDFAHLYARSLGELNSYEGFSKILEKIENKLGKEGINNMHIHFSGIEYGNTGERNHLNFSHSKNDYKPVLKALKDFNANGIMICESPNLETDALLLQKTYKSL